MNHNEVRIELRMKTNVYAHNTVYHTRSYVRTCVLMCVRVSPQAHSPTPVIGYHSL